MIVIQQLPKNRFARALSVFEIVAGRSVVVGLTFARADAAGSNKLGDEARQGSAVFIVCVGRATGFFLVRYDQYG